MTVRDGHAVCSAHRVSRELIAYDADAVAFRQGEREEPETAYQKHKKKWSIDENE